MRHSRTALKFARILWQTNALGVIVSPLVIAAPANANLVQGWRRSRLLPRPDFAAADPPISVRPCLVLWFSPW
jgi:hypothetical protein